MRRLKQFLKDQEKKAEQKKRDDKQTQQRRQVVNAQGALEDAVLRKKLVRVAHPRLRGWRTRDRPTLCPAQLQRAACLRLPLVPPTPVQRACVVPLARLLRAPAVWVAAAQRRRRDGGLAQPLAGLACAWRRSACPSTRPTTRRRSTPSAC